MLREFTFFINIIIASVISNAQNLTILKEIPIPMPVAISADRYGSMYVGDSRGNVYKYDSTGTLLQTFSSPIVSNISSIEAWPSLQIFVFYKDSQQFSILNRFLTPTLLSIPLNSEIIGFARTATLGSQENIWLFDDTDFSIKKYDLPSKKVLITSPLSLILSNADYNLNFMREYQNTLYINDSNSGILVFDNLGNYKKKLSFPGLTYFNFYDNDLYFLRDNSLVLFDIYTLKEEQIILPSGFSYMYALFSGSKMWLFTKNSIQIYQFHKI